jgi:rhodanese-related sulfurtransferase
MEPSRIRAVDLLDSDRARRETVLIDTRNPKAWAESDQKLPGALRIPTDEIELHTHKLPRD